MPAPKIICSLSVRGLIGIIALAAPIGLSPAFAGAEDAPSSGDEVSPAFMWNSFFVGMRSPQLGDGAAAAPALMSAGRPETVTPPDLYLGYEKQVDGVRFGARALFVAQPGAVEAGFATEAAQSSYWRFKAGASANLVEGLQLGFNVQYAPDAVANGSAGYLDGPAQDFSSFARAMAHNAGINPGGNSAGASDAASEDVMYDVGVSFKLPFQSKVDLRYYKTIEGPITTCAGGCPAFFAAALQTKF